MTEDRAANGEARRFPAHEVQLAKPFHHIPRLGAAGLGLCAALLAGCSSTPVQEVAVAVAVSPSAPGSFPRERLIGNWGTASFHNAKDRKRTEAEARAQCSQPYVIGKGPSDGVMMHAADDPKRYELKLKDGPGGKTYLGFEAPAGDPQDREILSATATMLVMRFVDPDVHKRYGTFVYVRCGRQA